MHKAVDELHIISADKNIFDTETEYVIPLYQRAYAWENTQLIQLLEDISDVSDGTNYYIGSLIVSKINGKYEVVDGQQRLTSLFLLLNCLGLPVKNTLTFACREKSNYTLKNVRALIQGDTNKFEMDRIETTIYSGVDILNRELKKRGFDKDSFLKKLSRVIIYRIEVPENTDLNRYFEIMNTRGEQLEQHDVLKARLMGYLPPDEQVPFAKIWDACSDMTGYVQMHFTSKNNEVRKKLFGDMWQELPSDKWEEYQANEFSTSNSKYCIQAIIDGSCEETDNEEYSDEETRVRFESIIEFPYFLLHVLKVFVKIKGLDHADGKANLVAELLDDKKLLDSFEGVIENGVKDGNKINATPENRADFSRNFAVCLLRTRFLFDKYIIKREYASADTDGEWSLKSLHVSGRQSKKKPYYKNTWFIQNGKWETTNDTSVKNNIMIQSALRVSYTSPKVMHWITQLLCWLSEDACKHTNENEIIHLTGFTESIAQKGVKENFFDICNDGVYEMGVDTPHIVFNYLDYLLWRENRENYADFTFEFRNSVEHWYPQNPSEGTFEQWKDGVDRFGNLCIIQRNVNSKFSNLSPEAKKSTFSEMIAKGSLKLRLMSEHTKEGDGKAACPYWKETVCAEHEKQMIDLLRTNIEKAEG